MQAAHTLCTYPPPYHQRCWFLNWTLITCWKVSLIFSPEDMVSLISNKNVTFELVWPLNTFPLFQTIHLKWALAHNGASGPWSLMASVLHDRALVGICRWHGGLCLLTVVSGGVPGPNSNVNDRIMPMSDAASSEGPKTTSFRKSLRPCPLRTEISPVSLNLLMMLFAKPLQFAVEERCF